MHHLFCRHCGVRSFARGYAEAIGGDYIGIQLAALDKVDPQELISARGKNLHWYRKHDWLISLPIRLWVGVLTRERYERSNTLE